MSDFLYLCLQASYPNLSIGARAIVEFDWQFWGLWFLWPQRES